MWFDRRLKGLMVCNSRRTESLDSKHMRGDVGWGICYFSNNGNEHILAGSTIRSINIMQKRSVHGQRFLLCYGLL